ncbi:MAG TPA: PAS domain S-box protein [Gemmatimonas sp.]|uniref:PAS domain S-box protein n=1 Tax=Gemmatimonas sp. TaxID=1962908 RepID=UPI002ED995A1
MASQPRSSGKNFSNPFDRLTTRSLTWGAVIAAAVLAINVPLTVSNTREIERNAGWLAHSHEVVNELAHLQLLVKDAETGVRAFVVTGDSLDMVNVPAIRAAVAQRVSVLDTLLTDNAAQRSRLITLTAFAKVRLDALHVLQETAATQGFEAARKVMRGLGSGRRTGDSLRGLVDQMVEAERVLLNERAAQANLTYKQAARSGVFAGLAALVAFLGFVVVLRRELTARGEAAALLAEERERLDTTLRSIGDAVITTDTNGNITTMNAIAEQLTGMQSMAAVGKPLEEVYRIPFDPSTSLAEHPVRAVLAGRRSRSELHSLTLRAQDGTARPIDQTAAAIVTPSGVRLGGVLVFRDVSEQQATQQRIRYGQQRLMLALRSARLVSFDINLDTGELALSENGPDVFGLKPGHLLPTLNDALAIVHPEDLPTVAEALQSVDQPGEAFQVSCRILREVPGDFGWVEVRGEVQLTRDGKKVLTGLVLDVTERRAAEMSLRESEERFRSMADSAPVIIWMSASDGTITYVNQKWHDFTGIGPIDIAAIVPYERVHQDDREEQLRQFREAMQTHRTFRQELRMRRHDGTYRWVINTATPRFGEAGEFLGFIGSVLDIEDRKQLENELRSLAAHLSDADRRKDEFLATLAHELRNPLAPLRNGVEILRLAAPSPEIIERTRGMMERQLGQLVRLVDDLLDVSRITSGKLELRHDLLTLQIKLKNAAEASNPTLVARSQRLHITAPEAPVVVEGDAARLSQIFANLLDNASKYSPPDTDIHVSVSTTAKHAVVTVRDQGQGIPRHLLHKVFDLFAQVDRTLERTTGGLGIGLTLVKRLVEMHGGTITAESPGEGNGSTFTVVLPLAAANAGGGHTLSTDTGRSSADSLSLVICDDNVDASTTLATILRVGGHDVTTVHDGHEAIALARTGRAKVFILDLGMPGLNGFETAEQVRALPNGDSFVLIALTGWGNEEYRQRAKAAGFDHHLVKPADPRLLGELLTRVSRQLKATGGTAR